MLLRTFLFSLMLLLATVFSARAEAQQLVFQFQFVDPAGDTGSDGDMFTKVFLNGERIGGGRLSTCRCPNFPGACGCDFGGGWRSIDNDTTLTVDLAQRPRLADGSYELRIELWDADSGFNAEDDHMDITRGIPGKDVLLRVDPDSGTWTGKNGSFPQLVTFQSPNPLEGCAQNDGGLCWHAEVEGVDGDCDGVDDNRNGSIDEGCLVRFFFAPVCFLGNDEQFRAAVDAQMAEFRRLLELDTCSNRIALTVVPPSAFVGGPPCAPCATVDDVGAFVQSFTALQRPDLYDPAQYTAGALITDQDLCGVVLGSTGVVPKLVWSESVALDILPHEWGHSAGLSEEYCHAARRQPNGQPMLGDPNLGGSVNCNDLGSINALDPNLGCDPFQNPADPNACCSHAFRENGNPSRRSPDARPCTPPIGDNISSVACCAGNLSRDPLNPGFSNTQGGRCIMAAGGSQGPREYCRRCFAHWKGLNQGIDVPLDCSSLHGALPAGSTPILNFTYVLHDDGAIVVKPDTVFDGIGRRGFHHTGILGKFRIEVSDADDNILYAAFRNLEDAYHEIPFQAPLREGTFGLETVIDRALFGTPMPMRAYDESGSMTWQVTINGQPPVPDAGADVVLECSAQGGFAQTNLDGSASSDADDDFLDFEWFTDSAQILEPHGELVNVVAPFGMSSATLEVTDGLYSVSDLVDIHVQDTTPPSFVGDSSRSSFKSCVPGNVSFPLNAPGATDICFAVTVRGSVTTRNGQTTNLGVPGSAVALPVGLHTVTWTASDAVGNQATQNQSVEVHTAIGALRSINIRDNARVTNASLTNYGTGLTFIGPRARTGAIFTRGTVDRRAGAVTGTITSGPNVVLPPAPALDVVFPPATLGALSIEPGQTRTLGAHVAAAWDLVSVKSGGRLILAAGTHFFRSLQLEPTSSVLQLTGTGGHRIVIATEFLFSGQPIVNSTSVRPTVEYLGTNPVFLQRAFNGHLIAPNAEVTVRDPFTGTLLAGDLVVDAAETVSCALP